MLRRYRTFGRMTKAQRYRRINTYARTAWRRTRLVALFAFYAPFVLVLAAFRIRFLPTHAARHFGNLIEVPALHYRARESGVHPKARGILLAPSGWTVNNALADYWRAHYVVITNPFLSWLFTPFTWMPLVSEVRETWADMRARDGDGAHLRGGLATVRIQQTYEDKVGSLQVLEIKEDHYQKGMKNLERLGLPEGSWWVALHVREAASLGEYHATHRNADISTYFDAARLIESRGGRVIRVGDPNMSRLPEGTGIIDYVHSGVHADWMDLFITGKSRFLLGANSGASLLASVFGRPVAIANFTPVGNAPNSRHDLFIPKLHWSEREDRFLSFPELFSSQMRDGYRDRLFQENGVRLIDSTSDQILSLTEEMLERLDGDANYTDDDERLQAQYKSIWLENPTEHTYGTQSRVGRSFLREQAHLLG